MADRLSADRITNIVTSVPRMTIQQAPRIVGQYYTSEGITNLGNIDNVGENNLASNQTIYTAPFIVITSETFDKAAINVWSFTAECNAIIGIYNADESFMPTTKIAEAVLPVTGEGFKEATFTSPITLEPGLYALVIIPSLSGKIGVEQFNLLFPLLGVDINSSHMSTEEYIPAMCDSTRTTYSGNSYPISATLPEDWSTLTTPDNVSSVLPGIWLHKSA